MPSTAHKTCCLNVRSQLKPITDRYPSFHAESVSEPAKLVARLKDGTQQRISSLAQSPLEPPLTVWVQLPDPLLTTSNTQEDFALPGRSVCLVRPEVRACLTAISWTRLREGSLFRAGL